MDEDIAVVGIGCHFPGGEGLDNFWQVLVEGRNCTVDIPCERFDSSLWYDPDTSRPGKTQTTKAALIDGFNELDHKLLGITEAEADQMDPQQKLLLKCSYRALEDAGIPMEKASGTRTGVYIGLMNRDYEALLNNNASTITHYNSTGTAMSVAANRISYTFNLTGPSFALDSACSSSLVALHLACQAIRQGDCDMALCGGVSCILEPRMFVALSKAKMTSTDGTSKPFSSKADGYGRGEGCGIVLLQTLKKALEGFHHVWGIISKTALNQDGRTVTPITKPSMVQQEQLLSMIYSSETDLMSVQYIEAHGTGTPVGDPVEASSISKVIAKARPPGSETLLIGSVKGNIGHTESTAGVAGLIKVLLMMKHETIVPTLFYSDECSSIDTKALNIKIPTKLEKWPKGNLSLKAAGINNFGFGGTNVHAIVKEYKKPFKPKVTRSEIKKTFVLSAMTERSLHMCISDMYNILSTCDAVDLSSIAYTSACRRSHARHRYRKVFMSSTVAELKDQLRLALDTKILPYKSDLKLVFVFCGNGTSFQGMFQQLLKQELVFREKVREVESVFKSQSSVCSSHKMARNNPHDISQVETVQSLLFAFQVALVSLLKHWGIRPDVVIGHSVGEVAAAHCSGLLSLADAVKVICCRSALQATVSGGSMLVVGNVPIADVAKILSSYSGKVCIAAINSPVSSVLSGQREAIEDIQHKLRSLCSTKDVFLHILDVPAAYHSHMMDPILNQIKEEIGLLRANEVECELYSTVTGKRASLGDFTTGEYWARNIRKPVNFQQALESAVKDKPNVVFVEVSPKRALHRNIRESLGNDVTILSTAQPNNSCETLVCTLARLFELGYPIDWDNVFKGSETPLVGYLRYHFDSTKKYVYFETVRQGPEPLFYSAHPLLNQSKDNGKQYTCNLQADVASFLCEHKHNGTAVVPGSLFVELAFEAGMQFSKPKKPLCSFQLNIIFENICDLQNGINELKVHLESEDGKIIYEMQCASITYASGNLTCKTSPAIPEVEFIDSDSISKRCLSVLTKDDVYSHLSLAGFEYGPTFRLINNICYGGELGEALTKIEVPDELFGQLYDYRLNPVLMDCFLQMASVVTQNGGQMRPCLPSAIGSVLVVKPLQKVMVMYQHLTCETSNYYEVCGCFADPVGHVLVEVKHLKFTFVPGPPQSIDFLQPEVHALTGGLNTVKQSKALVFEDELGVAKALRPYVFPHYTFVSLSEIAPSVSSLLFKYFCASAGSEFKEVIFMQGIQDLSQLKIETVLDRLVECCEHYRQTALFLRQHHISSTIRVITYRSSSYVANHISPGFVLPGMMRTLAAEMSGIFFQWIDVASVTAEDMQVLACTLHGELSKQHPEIVISNGQVHFSTIGRSQLYDQGYENSCDQTMPCQRYTLLTSNPYMIHTLSTVRDTYEDSPIADKIVMVKLEKICIHSSDYFPVSISSLKFGQTMYWIKHSSKTHPFLALDFSGTVTAVGKNVKRLQVGDPITCCYPVVASSYVRIPEEVCIRTTKLPCLRDVPCISYFILARVIFDVILFKVGEKMAARIVSTSPKILTNLVVEVGKSKGWTVNISTLIDDNGNNCAIAILLPPYDQSMVLRISRTPSVKTIVMICDDKSTSLSQLMKRYNQNAQIHVLETCDIFEKANCLTQGLQMERWLHDVGHGKIFQIFQKNILKTEYTLKRATSYENAHSYFNMESIPLIVCTEALSHQGPAIVTKLTQAKNLFQQDCVYVVSGGLSGLGFETVRFIAQRGGGHIISLSRRQPSDEVQSSFNMLQHQYNVSIMTLKCDVSLVPDVLKAFKTIALKFPLCPVKGVFHSAAVLHDGLIETLDISHFRKVLKPKVNGALNLHFATLHSKLDYFICYSSISSFLGNASQANYASANSFLDAFCQYRRNIGLAGQSINWGPLNLGLLLNKVHFHKFLGAKGLNIMSTTEMHLALERCLLTNNVQQVICKLNFRNFHGHVLSQNASLRARLMPLVEQNLKIGEQETALETQSVCAVEDYVKSLLCDLSNADMADLKEDSTLSSLGIDSMSAMTMQNRIFQDKAITVSLVKLLDPHSTLTSLVLLLKQESNVCVTCL